MAGVKTRSDCSKLEEKLLVLESAMQLLRDELIKLKPVSAELESEKNLRECAIVELGDTIGGIGRTVQDLAGKVEALSISFEQREQERLKVVSEGGEDGSWQVVGGRKRAGAKQGESRAAAGRNHKVTWGEQLEVTGDKVVVLGDSLARGVGYKMKKAFDDVFDVYLKQI